MTREHFQGPISHHLCRECIQSVCLSFCPSLPLLYNWGGFIIIVALICLLRTSPLLSFCCTCLSLMLSRCTLGAGVAVELFDLRLSSFLLCLLIYLFLFLCNILSLPSEMLSEFDFVSMLESMDSVMTKIIFHS